MPSQRALGPVQDVYIHGGRIAAIYEAGSPAREAATILDAGGRALLPGALRHAWPHVELGRAPAPRGGVTTVRDMGNDNAVLAEMLRRIDARRDGRARGS